jgi:hypothetical protein
MEWNGMDGLNEWLSFLIVFLLSVFYGGKKTDLGASSSSFTFKKRI